MIIKIKNTSSKIKVFWIILFLFIVLTFLNIHGFSLPLWHEIIDGSKPTELIAGKLQGIRSDDWIVNLPLLLSQTATKPSFQKNNKVIAEGTNTLINFSTGTPVNSWFTIFKPSIWGFFMGKNIGISWLWWYQMLGLILSSFLFFMILTKNNTLASILASISFTYSPFMQFWSLNSANIFIAFFICCIAFYNLIKSQNYKNAFIFSLLIIWSGINFITYFYPAYLIPLSYIFIFYAISVLIKNRYVFKNKKTSQIVISSLIFSIITSLLIFYFYLINVQDAIELLKNTSYPSQRISTGGNQNWFLYLFNLLTPFQANPDLKQIGLNNICEASTFLYLFPLTFMVIIVNYKNIKKTENKVLIFSFLTLTLIFFFYSFWGVNYIISKIFMFSYVPTQRIHAGMGVLNIVLILLLSNLSKKNIDKKSNHIFSYLISFLWAVVLIIMYFKVKNLFEPRWIFILIFLLISWIITGYFLASLKIKLFFISYTILSILLTFWFNPLVKGGANFIYNNELSKKIVEIFNKNPNKSWVTYGPIKTENLPRMLGVKSIDGVHFYPNFKIWKTLDTEEKNKHYYNRYAHVKFVPPNSLNHDFFNLPSPDTLLIYLQPNDSFFIKNNVHFYITDKELLKYFDKKYFKIIFESNNKLIIKKTRMLET